MKTTKSTKSEKTKIIPIMAGVGHCYLVIHTGGYFLVDTGSPGYGDKIINHITSRGLNINDLQFIFLTHTHYDHAGNARLIKKASSAPILVHRSEGSFLAAGWHEVPGGTNPLFKVISWLGRHFSPSHAQFEAVEADILFDEKYSTEELGARAIILHTPGHTTGSSSLLIDEQLLGGDSIFNIAGKIWPPFANDEAMLLKTWQKLNDLEVDNFYPAHGKRFSKSVFERELKKRLG